MISTVGTASETEQKWGYEVERPTPIDLAAQSVSTHLYDLLRAIDALPLGPYAQAILIHALIADTDENTKELAQATRMSVGMVSKTKAELFEHGYITYEAHGKGKGQKDVVRVTRKVWYAYRDGANRSYSEQLKPTVHTVNSSRERADAGPSELKSIILNHSSTVRHKDSAFSTLSDPVFEAFSSTLNCDASASGPDDEVDAAFAIANTPPTVPPAVTQQPKGPPFRLTAPNLKRPSKRAKVRPRGPNAPDWAINKLYTICFGWTSMAQIRASETLKIRGRVADAVSRLLEFEADLRLLDNFAAWWKSWAKTHPTPEQVVTYWGRSLGVVESQEESEAIRASVAKGNQDAINFHSFKRNAFYTMVMKAYSREQALDLLGQWDIEHPAPAGWEAQNGR
jgi:hypothetical protein